MFTSVLLEKFHTWLISTKHFYNYLTINIYIYILIWFEVICLSASLCSLQPLEFGDLMKVSPYFSRASALPSTHILTGGLGLAFGGRLWLKQSQEELELILPWILIWTEVKPFNMFSAVLYNVNEDWLKTSQNKTPKSIHLSATFLIWRVGQWSGWSTAVSNNILFMASSPWHCYTLHTDLSYSLGNCGMKRAVRGSLKQYFSSVTIGCPVDIWKPSKIPMN